MDRKRFLQLLDEGAPSSAKDSQRVNWEGIFADAAKNSVPLSARQFYDEYIDGKCGFSYAKKKLGDLFDKKRVARILDAGAYYYSFDPADIEHQHGQ